MKWAEREGERERGIEIERSARIIKRREEVRVMCMFNFLGSAAFPKIGTGEQTLDTTNPTCNNLMTQHNIRHD